MDVILTVFLILIIFAIIGVLVYMLYDFNNYKESTHASFQKTSTTLNTLVGDVNKADARIYDIINTNNSNVDTTFRLQNTRFDSNLSMQGSDISNLRSRQALYESEVQKQLDAQGANTLAYTRGLDSLISIQSNINISSSARNGLPITNLPGRVNPDVQLMQHVSAVSGMTVRNAAAEANRFQVCASPASATDIPRCVQFPNSTGDTYLTGLAQNSQVIIDSPATLTNALSFGPGRYRAPNSTTMVGDETYGSIRASPSSGIEMTAPGVSIRSPGPNPQSTLPQPAPFKVSVANADKLSVNADGTMSMVTNKLNISNGAATDTRMADITFDSTGRLVLTPASGSATGTVRIVGNIEATGSISSNVTVA